MNTMMAAETAMMGMAPMAMPAMMIPRCTVTMQSVPGGMTMRCTGADEMATTMMKNVVNMLGGTGMLSCAMMMNGAMVMRCAMTMGMCTWTMDASGLTVTCTSGDPMNAGMIETCCQAMMAMLAKGCSCCVMMNNTPVCMSA